jgi:hypothetical protein
MFIVIPEAYYGAGRHAYYLAADPAKQEYGLYLNFISQPFFLVGVVLVKVSIGLFLLRLTPSQFFHRFIWCMLAFMATYTTVALSMYHFPSCISYVTDLGCSYYPYPMQTFESLMGLFGQRCCLFLATWPAGLRIFQCRYGLLWKVVRFMILTLFRMLHLCWSRLCIATNSNPVESQDQHPSEDRYQRYPEFGSLVRIPLSQIFFHPPQSKYRDWHADFISALAACIVKVYYLSFYGSHNDFLWDSVNITIWTACELNIGLFAASIATLRPLFRSAFAGSTFSNGYDGSNDHKSLDKNGFVKHISNSRGTNKIGGSNTSKDDGYEMYGSMVTANGKRTRIDADNESEESILPLQKPPTGIRKTTEVTVDEMQMKRSVEDRVWEPCISPRNPNDLGQSRSEEPRFLLVTKREVEAGGSDD